MVWPFSLCCTKNEEGLLHPQYTHPAEGILYRADFLVGAQRYSEAMVCYQQGFEILEALIESKFILKKNISTV
jgi:hypothetical protein